MPRDSGRYYQKNFAGSRYLCNQNGIALVASLILMTVLSLLIITTIQYATQDITRTKNYTETLQATYIAEAGIHRALGYFNYDASGDSPGEVSNGFDDELDNSNWPAGTFTNISLGSGGGAPIRLSLRITPMVMRIRVLMLTKMSFLHLPGL